MQKVAADRSRVSAGETNLTRYGSRDFSDHYFCNRCGIHVFTRSSRDTQAAIVLNLACLENVDVGALTPRVFDGARSL